MSWIVARIKGLMLVTGLVTCTMLYAAIAPRAAMSSTFGESLEGTWAEIVVRSWGTLIGLVGAMLIYGAYRPAVRSLVLTVAAVSKATFIALVLLQGRQYLGHQAGVAVVVDALTVVLFALYFLGVRSARSA